MPTYLLIRLLLLSALVVIAISVLRPIRSAKHLAIRRLGLLLLTLGAGIAVLYPGILHRLAQILGVATSVNLLLYGLAVALIVHMSATFRREVEHEQKLTRLARAIALTDVQDPGQARH